MSVADIKREDPLFLNVYNRLSLVEKIDTLYLVLDLIGTFAFAVSGAVAARQYGLDLFGIAFLAMTVATGGGIIRDVCIGALPPAGLSTWYYLATALLAVVLTVSLYGWLEKLKRPVILFDAIGLAFFAVFGAEKTIAFGHNGMMAVFLGVITAVGGGAIRDILLTRIPMILKKEIYAAAALLAAIIVVGGHYLNLPADGVAIFAIGVCFSLRMVAVTRNWNLPFCSEERMKKFNQVK